MTKRKRRTRAEMQEVREAVEHNNKIKDKVEKGVIDTEELLLSSLPKLKEKEFVYVDRPVQVIKEVRILKDKQGTELSVTDIIKQELDLVQLWEYKQIPVNEFSVKDLSNLGKDGWKFAFELSPGVSPAFKVMTLVFQRAKIDG